MGKILERMFTMEINEFNDVFMNSKSGNVAQMEQDYHRINLFNDEIVLRS